MIIWKGLGFLILLIPIASMFLTFAAHQIVFGREHFMEFREYTFVTAGIITALSTWKIGRRLNRQLVRVTDATGNQLERYEHETFHSLFFIAFEYWAIPYLVLTGYFAIKGSLPQA